MRLFQICTFLAASCIEPAAAPVQVLLEHDADVDAVDADSRTLLMLASSNGMAGMVSQASARVLTHVCLPTTWWLVLSGQCCRSISCCCLVLTPT